MNDIPILGTGAHESKKSVQDIHAHQVLDMAGMPYQDVVITYGHPHLNQRGIGICTAIDLCDMAQKIWGIPFSSKFTYIGGKKNYDGNMLEGSSNLTMLKFGKNFGFLPLSFDPTGNDCHGTFEQFVNAQYTPEQFAEANKYKLSGYALAPLDPVGFATALQKSKYGLITRMDAGTNFFRPSWSKVDLELLRDPNPISSGHAVKVVETHGLDNKQIRLLRNTWGDKDNPTTDSGLVWSDDGNIRYEYDTQAPYVTEAYVVFAEPMIFKHTFSTPIIYGQTSPEVTALQRVLVGLGFLTMPVGVSFGYYGNLTAQAVLTFQRANNVAPEAQLAALAGKRVGLLTISALNKIQGIV